MDIQTGTLDYEILTAWDSKPRTTPQNTSGQFMGPEQVTRPKRLQYV